MITRSAAQHARPHLHRTGPLQEVHAQEGFCAGLANRQRAVIVQQHDVLGAEVPLKTRPLIVIEGDAFVIVIGEVGDYELRRLIKRQKPFLRGRNRGPVRCVQMNDATGIVTHLVNRGMDGEARRVHRVRRVSDCLAVEPDFQKARRRDLLEHHPIGVDEKMMLRAWNACRYMRENEIVPAMERDEPIACGQIDADAAFGIGHEIQGPDVLIAGCHEGLLPIHQASRATLRR